MNHRRHILACIALLAAVLTASFPRIPASAVGPHIDINPDSLGDTLYTGETSQKQLVVRNLGDSDLVWSLGSGMDGTRILVTQLYGTNRSTMIADLESRGAIVDPVIIDIATVLPNYDILWATPNSAGLPQQDIIAIQNWLAAGGSALLEASNDPSVAPFNAMLALLSSGITYSPAGGSAGITNNIHPHVTTTGIANLFLASPNISINPVAPPAAPLFDDRFEAALIGAASTDSTYRIVALADEILHNSWIGSWHNQLFGNQVFDYLVPTSPTWLLLSPSAGTIAPGDSPSPAAYTSIGSRRARSPKPGRWFF